MLDHKRMRAALVFAPILVVLCTLALGSDRRGGVEKALAADTLETTISIKNHKFDPAEIKVPAGKAVKLTVKNLDDSAEEFESHALKVEKVIAGKSTAIVRLKGLAKGRYPFVGEYHESTAKGVLIVE